MVSRRKNGRGPRGTDSGAHWISYSDMMASLLLVFVLAVCYSVYQYYNMLEIKTQQLNEQRTSWIAPPSPWCSGRRSSRPPT